MPGPWEFRGKLQRHTFSAAISWAGCDRLGRIARRVGDAIAARDWSARASYMRQEILTGAWSEERQAFTSAFGNRDLDATALLLPELGLLPATDPRFLKTLERIEEELRVGDLLFRYKHADDFGQPENAFTICAFWYVNALAAAGRVDEARERFTRLLARAQSARPALRRHPARERRALGQFSADLQHGGSDRQRTAAVTQLGGDRMTRLVAVSNRISVPKRGAAPGGLAVGLLAAMQARRGLWFGWDGETAEVASDEPSVVRKDGVTFASIDIDQAEYRDFYLGFCNGTLWPLFHYFVDGFRYNDTQYEAYQRMNQRYARLLLPLLEPRRPHLGARLPPVSAGAEAARGGSDATHRPVPAHTVSQHRSAARAAGVRRAAAGHAGLRRARFPDRDRSRRVSRCGGLSSGARRCSAPPTR